MVADKLRAWAEELARSEHMAERIIGNGLSLSFFGLSDDEVIAAARVMTDGMEQTLHNFDRRWADLVKE